MMTATKAADDLWFLQGGGEAGATARATDWERTPLGAPHAWPSTLKTTVATMLRARQPMFLWWGDELTQLYNDAYLPSFRHGKHPRAMGQPGRECWAEIWPIIGPQVEDVMQRASATWDEDALIPIFRNGRIEDVYWTYTYSPVFDETGAVKAVLVICTETTTRVLAERRSTLLCSLLANTSQSSNLDGLVHSALEVLGRSSLDIPFAAFATWNECERAWAMTNTAGLDDLARKTLLSSLDYVLQRDKEARFAVLHTPVDMAVPEFSGNAVNEVYCAPLHEAGEHHSFIVLGVSPRLAKDAHYRRFFQQIAAQLRADRSRVLEAVRRSVVELERRNLLEHAPVATALLVGPDHLFELANPLYRQMVGRPDLVGKTYLEAFPELKGTQLPAVLDRVYTTGEPFATSEQLVAIDKGEGKTEDCYFRFNLEPVRDQHGQVYGMMAVAVEVTEQVVSRLILEKAHAERERLLQDVEKASRAKDEFLAMLGHELRNPLSPILTALELMRLKSGGETSREQDIIQRQARHLIRLVDDLLDVAKIARGKVELRRAVVDLYDVVMDAAETASHELEHGRHRLSLELERGRFFCQGDRGRLSQVVSNLLTNAARYTPQGGHVSVRCIKQNGELVLSVVDNGVGISEDMLATVFTLFEQGKRSTDRRQGGLGIGLALVKNLMTLHGGSVSAHSAGLGTGSEFVIRLPAVTSGELSTQPQEEDTRRRSLVSRRVLLVDDNVDALEMLQLALETAGHKVARTSDPLKGLKIAAEFAPDVAVLDIGLPVMDGYELAGQMRELRSCQSCRFVALTGYGQASDRQRSEAAGFTEHLVKPVDVDRLLGVIEAGGDAPDVNATSVRPDVSEQS